MHSLAYLFALTTLLAPPELFATTVYRCEDSLGKVTFTHLGCSTEQTLQPLTVEPTPVTDPTETPEDDQKRVDKTPRKAVKQEKQHAVFGIGQRVNGCANTVTASARRRAMIDKEVRPGMTRADVESMLGKPNTISSQNGRMRYNYIDKQEKGRKRSVSFDENGCVTGKP